MLNPFGLANPFGGSAPAPVAPVAPVTPVAPDPGVQADRPGGAGAAPRTPENIAAEPGETAYAATEDDIRRILEAQTNPPAPENPQNPQNPNPQNPVTPAPVQTPVPGAILGQTPQDVQQIRQIQTAISQLDLHTEAAYGQLVAGGMNPADARAAADNARTNVQLHLENALTRATTAPAARQMVAADIAARHSIPGQVTISAQDLLNETSPDAMIARARTLAETRRDARVQTRVAERRDVVESSSGVNSGAATATRSMNAFETIRSGLRSRSNTR